MKCLPHCIMREWNLAGDALPLGVAGEPVSLAAEAGLVAAFSPAPDSCATPTLSLAAGHAQVVAAFHKIRTVLPLRYGRPLDSEARLVELLRERREEFQASLDTLDGCVEMGVRVLVLASAQPPAKNARHAAAPSSGKAYLARREAQYADTDRRRAQAVEVAAGTRRAFEGLFEKWRCGLSGANGGLLLSLNFLVRRQNLARFRQTFGRLQRTPAHKLLLTGPWPPYSFAHGGTTPEDALEHGEPSALNGAALSGHPCASPWFGESV